LIPCNNSHAKSSKKLAKELDGKTVRIKFLDTDKYLSVKDMRDSAWMIDLPSYTQEAVKGAAAATGGAMIGAYTGVAEAAGGGAIVGVGISVVTGEIRKIFAAHYDDKNYVIPKFRLVADASKENATLFMIKKRKRRFVSFFTNKARDKNGKLLPLFAAKSGLNKRFAKNEVTFFDGIGKRKEQWKLVGSLKKCYIKNRANKNFLTIPQEKILATSYRRKTLVARRSTAFAALRKSKKKKKYTGNMSYTFSSPETAWTGRPGRVSKRIKLVHQKDIEAQKVVAFRPAAAIRMRKWARSGKWRGQDGKGKKRKYPHLIKLVGQRVRRHSWKKDELTEFEIEIVE
jgi:hypothetical protein